MVSILVHKINLYYLSYISSLKSVFISVGLRFRFFVFFWPGFLFFTEDHVVMCSVRVSIKKIIKHLPLSKARDVRELTRPDFGIELKSVEQMWPPLLLLGDL